MRRRLVRRAWSLVALTFWLGLDSPHPPDHPTSESHPDPLGV